MTMVGDIKYYNVMAPCVFGMYSVYAIEHIFVVCFQLTLMQQPCYLENVGPIMKFAALNSM